jgi:hypothetical protein
LSLSGTAAAVIVSGFLNVSRARHSDGLTRAFSVIGNLLILMLAVEIAWDSGSEVDECWKECSPDNHCVHVPLLHASGAEFPL